MSSGKGKLSMQHEIHVQRWLVSVFAVLLVLAISRPSLAVETGIDLSEAESGTLIEAPGGGLAQTFAGQTVVGGTGISGSPLNPLTLEPSGTLTVENWNPGVSPASNSIRSQPDNQGPISVLLDSDAAAITWTMGMGGGSEGSVDIEFFDASGVLVKTGIMVGLGETMDEVKQTMLDVRAWGVDILTIGQYLQPTKKHLPIERYYEPAEFEALKAFGAEIGFRWVESGPLVRSSYHAEQQVRALSIVHHKLYPSSE